MIVGSQKVCQGKFQMMKRLWGCWMRESHRPCQTWFTLHCGQTQRISPGRAMKQVSVCQSLQCLLAVIVFWLGSRIHIRLQQSEISPKPIWNRLLLYVYPYLHIMSQILLCYFLLISQMSNVPSATHITKLAIFEDTHLSFILGYIK